MLHHVHQLIANCACLLFGAEQAVFSGFTEAFYSWNDAFRAVTVNQNIYLQQQNQNNKLKESKMLIVCGFITTPLTLDNHLIHI